jgi:hypothetical protein
MLRISKGVEVNVNECRVILARDATSNQGVGVVE